MAKGEVKKLVGPWTNDSIKRNGITLDTIIGEIRGKEKVLHINPAYTNLDDLGVFFCAKEKNLDIAPALFLQRVVGLLNDGFLTPAWRESVENYPAGTTLTVAQQSAIWEDFNSRLNTAISGETTREKGSPYYAKLMKEIQGDILPLREKAKDEKTGKASLSNLNEAEQATYKQLASDYQAAKANYDLKLSEEQSGLLDSLDELS